MYLKEDLQVFLKEYLLNRIDLTYSVHGILPSIIVRHYLLLFIILLYCLLFLYESLNIHLLSLFLIDTHPNLMGVLYFLPIDLPYVYLDICLSLKNIFCCFINNIFKTQTLCCIINLISDYFFLKI